MQDNAKESTPLLASIHEHRASGKSEDLENARIGLKGSEEVAGAATTIENDDSNNTRTIRTSSTSVSSSLGSFNSSFTTADSQRMTSWTGTNNSIRQKLQTFLSRSSRFFTSESIRIIEVDNALKQNPGIRKAATLVHDALFGQQPVGLSDPHFFLQHDRNESSIPQKFATICGIVTSYRPIIYVWNSCAWILVILTFFEPPYWCRHYQSTNDSSLHNDCNAIMAAKGIPASDANIIDVIEFVEYYPNTHSILLTVEQAFVVESLCVGFMIAVILLSIGQHRFVLQSYFKDERARWNRVTQIICLILLTIGISTGYTRFNCIIRLFLLASFTLGAQKDIKVLVKLLPDVMNILFLLFLLMVFYAWFGCVMFVGTAEGKVHFSGLVESMWTLWICITTANYPDVMMLSYNETRWAALYFVSFMMISFFFLMNVILATVVNEYDNAVKERKEDHTKKAQHNLKEAFHLMDSAGTRELSKENMMALFSVLSECFPEFNHLNSDTAKILFALLDQDGSNAVEEHEFMNIPNVMLLEFEKASDYVPFVKVYFPSIWESDRYQQFCDYIRSEYFERFVDCIVALNAIVVAIQSYPELSSQEISIDPRILDGSVDTIWELLEATFAVLYALEVIIKISVYGWKTYTENSKNIFDFVITVLSILSTVVVYYPNDFSDSRLIRMIIAARVLRLLRLLMSVKRFRLIGTISTEIIPAAKHTILVLFLLVYLFASIGMTLYGGMISRDPRNPLSNLLLGTDFSDNSYWANNFNDMLSGMNVLFNLLVVNNWTECEIGFEAVTQARWVRFYFVLFHILGVVLINNLVIAVVINSFMEHLSYIRANEGKPDEVVGNGEAVLRQEKAFFDATQITGTQTFLSGVFVAKLKRRVNSDLSNNNSDTEKLRKLFTQTSSVTSEKS